MAQVQTFQGRKFTSPVGVAGFVALTAPFTKQGANDFKVSLRFEDPDDIKEIMEVLNGVAEEDKDARGKKCNLPITWEEDETTGEPTGALVVRFKALAGGIAKTGRNVGQEWSHDLLIRQPEEGIIGPGSELAVQFIVRQTEYQKKNYLQLKPIRVKVTKLVAYEGADGGGDDGFFDDARGVEVKAKGGAVDLDEDEGSRTGDSSTPRGEQRSAHSDF